MKNSILIIFSLTILSTLNFAQIITDFSCYTVSSENNAPNLLFEYDPFTKVWNEIGATGGKSIDAIAINPTSGIIYTVDGGTFGTINPITAEFRPIGIIGYANGSFGEIVLNAIKGLTYDPMNMIMYGIHRITGNGPETDDLIFRIDISSGKVVIDAMFDNNKNPSDYAIVQSPHTKSNILNEVNDIAYNPYTGDMFAIHSNAESNATMISQINPHNGNLEMVLFDSVDNIKGLGFTYYGELYATTGDKSSIPNSGIYIEYFNGESYFVTDIDPTGKSKNFESFDCKTSFNDLALDMILSNPSETISLGGNLTGLITIYNQGNIDNTDILITNYIPDGLTLNDQMWLQIPGTNNAEIIIPGPLVPGHSATIPITFTIDINLSACSITSAAEITASFSPDVNDKFGNPISLVDIDSEPDNRNNEINVVDNEISGGGSNAAEDEDDHDIATLLLLPETNYSGCIKLILDNNENILKNDVATVFDYDDCMDYKNLNSCNPVIGLNNKSANEALWIITKAAEYFSSTYDIQIPSVNIIVNDTKDSNKAKFNPQYNTIVLGNGDNKKRKPMTAPDIVAHEYLHFLQHNLDSFLPTIENKREAGALRESFADIFGEIIEYHCYGENDWVFGSQVMVPGSGKLGIRSLSKPKDTNMETQTPDTYLEDPWVKIEYNCDSNDRCGIHTNCGVQNHWFYKLANEVSGSLGFQSAIDVAFKNFTENLLANATYTDAANGSIQTAKTPEEKQKIKEAWQEVGIEVDLNFTEWKLVPAFLELGNIVDEVKFDLRIDSLGEDISGDGLNITLHLDETHQGLTEEDILIYKPLTESEVDIDIGFNEVTFCINREASEKIKSNRPLFRVAICIEVLDAGEEYCYEPVQISGHTEISTYKNIEFEPKVLPMGIGCISPDDDGEISNLLFMSIDITQKTCSALGSIEVEVFDNIIQGIPPYTFSLEKHNTVIENITQNENKCAFDSLDEGYYTLNVVDDQYGKAEIDFEISFIAETRGSLCCPENLVIQPGTTAGSFNATIGISFSNGALISEGYFEICKNK